MRAARPEDLPHFVELLEAAAERWWARGVRQWPPGSQRARTAWMASLLAEGALLLAEDAEGVAAGAILTAATTRVWRDAEPPGPGGALEVHVLAVARRVEGRGIGRRLLARLDALARREGAAALRLDCWDGNEALRRLYAEAGLRPCEAVTVGDAPLRRFEHRSAAGPLAGPPLPLGEPVPRIPPAPRRTTSPLPPYRYVPGGGAPHPVRDPRGHAHGAPEPDVSDLDPARVDRALAFRRGADLFDACYWWEAHEAWEALWVALGRRGPQAEALQGLIQAAAACLKRFAGEGATAARLAERGLAALGPAPAGLPTLDAPAFARALRAFVAHDGGRPPVLRLASEPGAPGGASASAGSAEGR